MIYNSTFEPGVTTLVLRLLPQFLPNKTIKAREHLVQAFTGYFRDAQHKAASELVKARYEYIVNQHQIHDVADLARLEVAGAFAIIANTVPTAFWVLYHIFSDPGILEECRRELSLIVQKRGNTCYLDINSIKPSCHILQSTFHEVLRFHGVQISLRKVMEDHVLDDRFLLKKGSALMMPATVQHFDPSVWGPNAGTFDHKRFARASSRNTKANVNRNTFRGFGGGRHLCPGRHFATTEILAFAALVILRFDLAPAEGTWTALKTDKLSSRGSAVTMPDNDMKVIISPRGDEHWEVFLAGSCQSMDIVAE